MEDEQTIFVDEFSVSSTFVEIRANNSVLGTATGFTYEMDGRSYFVTNWHVVTGWHPIKDVPLDPSGLVPDKLRVRFWAKENLGEAIWLEIELLGSDSRSKWFEHPIFQREVDVVTLEIRLPPEAEDLPINDIPMTKDYKVEVGQEVFILGYPFGLEWGGFPIWKRGSVASEPDIDMDRKPYLFVDAASRQGMSGSPTIFKDRRPVTILHADCRVERFFTGFIGVYSGREGVSEDESKMQLGRVWKKIVIDEIIHSRVRGKPGCEIH